MSRAAFLKRCYHAVPENFRPLLRPFVLAHRLLLRFRVPVYLWSGRSKAGSLPLSVAYAGSCAKHQRHYLETLFDGQPEISYAGRHFFWRIIGVAIKKDPACALVIGEPEAALQWRLKKIPHFLVPLWIRMEIDISQPMRSMLKNSRSGYRNITRLIGKYQYSCTKTISPDDCRHFYEHMYRPFAGKRFGEAAFIWRYEEVFPPGEACELYLLHKNATAVAGTVVKIENNCVRLCFFGIQEEYIDLLHQGFLGAVYYFIITDMQARGYDRMLIGDSRPFINNGVTRFKIRLLATLEKPQPYTCNRCSSFALLRPSSGVKDFLVHNPFMYFSKTGGLRGAVWLSGHEAVSDDGFLKVCGRMKRAGIEQCDIFTFQPLPAFPEKESRLRSVSVHDAHKYFLHS